MAILGKSVAGLDTEALRQDFPMLSQTMHGKPLVYLDSAATAQKPRSVIEAMQRFYTEKYATAHRAVYELSLESTRVYEEARAFFQRFLGAREKEEIIFTRGTTESINLVATCLGELLLEPGDEILLTEMEHHSNIVPWQLVQQKTQATLKVVPIKEDGTLDLGAFSSLLTKKTKIVACTHVSNVLGTINPIATLSKLAHEKGAYVLVDGAQAAPHFPVDVQELGADFYVFSGHKLYGPTAIGVLYGKKELLEKMPPYQGGGDMIDKVSFNKTTYNVLPLKFEAGTPLLAEACGLHEAGCYLERLGWEGIVAHEKKLLEYTLPRLLEIEGLKLFGPKENRCGVLSFVVEGCHSLDVGTLLDLQGIALRTGHHCCQPLMERLGVESCCRLSFGVTTTLKEVDYFLEALCSVVSYLRESVL